MPKLPAHPRSKQVATLRRDHPDATARKSDGRRQTEIETLQSFWTEHFQTVTGLEQTMVVELATQHWAMRHAEKIVNEHLSAIPLQPDGEINPDSKANLPLLLRLESAKRNAFRQTHARLSVTVAERVRRGAGPHIAQTMVPAVAGPSKAPVRRREKITAMTSRDSAQQWVEIDIANGKTITTLFPSNELLRIELDKMTPHVQLIRRYLHFVSGIPQEYVWADPRGEMKGYSGGCGWQEMAVETWLSLVAEEERRGDGHIGPTGLGNLAKKEQE